MAAENILYLASGWIAGSLLVTIFMCLVFRATEPRKEPKHD